MRMIDDEQAAALRAAHAALKELVTIRLTREQNVDPVTREWTSEPAQVDYDRRKRPAMVAAVKAIELCKCLPWLEG